MNDALWTFMFDGDPRKVQNRLWTLDSAKPWFSRFERNVQSADTAFSRGELSIAMTLDDSLHKPRHMTTPPHQRTQIVEALCNRLHPMFRALNNLFEAWNHSFTL
jgi:hypothetical protein